MKSLEEFKAALEAVPFEPKPRCIEHLHNRLQNLLFYLEAREPRVSGELIALKACAWVMHERYYMDNEEQLLWTFHHCKHKILRQLEQLLEREQLRLALRSGKTPDNNSAPAEPSALQEVALTEST